MRWVLSLQGGWGAQARSSFHSAQGGGRIVRQEREHDQTGDGESGEPVRSGDMGICASLCPPLSLSCWASCGCCLSGPPLPVPPPEAPMAALVCDAERRGGYLQVHHPCPYTLLGCSRVEAVPDCSTTEGGGFPLGNKEKAAQTPLPLH